MGFRPRAAVEIRAFGGPQLFRGKRVLEIGTGHGRLVWTYGGIAREVVAIDPDPEAIAVAREELARRRWSHVNFRVATAQRPHVAARHFDLALFAWSL